MPIPSLTEDGHLPLGLHDCTYAEIQATFGTNLVKDISTDGHRREKLCPERRRLCDRLGAYLAALRREFVDAGVAIEVLVDGSFTTSKPDPGDIDLIVILPADFDLSGNLAWGQEKVLHRRHFRDEDYPFDMKAVPGGSQAHQFAVRDFQRDTRIPGKDQPYKGLLRVKP